jgi:beta-lactamase regulating signal transducer with metallopeptidase domain
MLYCTLCALGLALAGSLAERLLLAGRAPVRIVWIGTLLLSLAIPLAVFRLAASAPAESPAATASSFIAAAAAVDGGDARVGSVRALAEAPGASRGWSTVLVERLGGIDSPLLIAWAALSAALALSFLSGVIGLAWMRRRWEQRVVQGATVYVSRRTGPAVVGTFSPAIVVPEWALSLAPSQLSLMLRHELEHLRARDGQLLIAAQIALIVMPWNVALWWQVLSLRVAIEMDCDARVLRGADARSYGELLLEVARPRRAFKFAGMIAFAERATQLERRIRVLKRHRVATSRRAAIAASTIAVVALSAAWRAPHPAVPARARMLASLPAAASLPLVVMHDVAAPTPLNFPTAPPRPVTRRPAAARTRKPAATCASDTSVVGATYRFLYDGVTLTGDNESKACELLARLVDEQLAEDAVAQATALDAQSRRLAIQARRNENLAGLLQTDVDRATFAANLERMRNVSGFARGRSGSNAIARVGPVGSVVGDTLIVRVSQEEARARIKRQAETGNAGGRGSGTVRMTNEPGAVNAVARISVDTLSGDREKLARVKQDVESTLRRLEVSSVERLFQGISLDPADAGRAKQIIGDAQNQMSEIAPPIRPGIRLRVDHARGVARIVAGADTPLIELAPSADREKVRARIVTVPQ